MQLIKQIWNGDLNLTKTFWLVFVVGTGIFNVISVIIEMNFDNIGEIGAFFSLIFILFFFSYLIYSYVATWRSATKYTINAKKKKKGVGWAYAAKTVVVLSALNGLAELVRNLI